MKRRNFLAAAGAVSALTVCPAAALHAAETKRILMVTWRGDTAVEQGFRDYLKRRGAAVELVVRDADRDPRKLAAIAAEISNIRPDLVYTWGTSVTLGIVGRHDAPNPAIGNVPTVFALVTDAAGAGIVPAATAATREQAQSPRRRAITGVSHVAPVTAHLEAIRRYRPFRRLGILYTPLEENALANVRELKALVKAMDFVLLEETFERSAEGKPTAVGIASKIGALRKRGAEWLYIGPDTYLFTQLTAVASAAAEVGLPCFATTEAVINAPEDILAGLVSPYREVGEFAAHKAMQILFERQRAADIPIETLKRFSLVIRLDVAKKMNLLPPLEFYDFAEIRRNNSGVGNGT